MTYDDKVLTHLENTLSWATVKLKKAECGDCPFSLDLLRSVHRAAVNRLTRYLGEDDQ